jgi:inosine/xanthosine triphosphatase
VDRLAAATICSGVSEQPKSLDEIITGAKNRAKGAFEHRSGGITWGFGIESGLFEVPHTKTGIMDICACVIYDGTDYHVGLSSAFECPPKVVELVHSQRMDLNDAFKSIGLTDNPKLGNAEGAVGLLTKNRVTRLDYIKQAIMMAMIHLENAEMYKKSDDSQDGLSGVEFDNLLHRANQMPNKVVPLTLEEEEKDYSTKTKKVGICRACTGDMMEKTSYTPAYSERIGSGSGMNEHKEYFCSSCQRNRS